MKFFILVLALLGQTALASNCANYNLLSEKDSLFRFLPSYDQGMNGLCYAYTAATLLNYHIAKRINSSKQPFSSIKSFTPIVHPAWVSSIYSAYENKTHLKIGLTSKAINLMLESKNCDYRKVEASILDWAKKTKTNESNFIALVDELNSKLTKIKLNKGSLSKNDFEVAYGQTVETITCCSPKIFKEMSSLVENLPTINSVQIINSIMLPHCIDSKKLPLSGLEARDIKFKQDYIEDNLKDRNPLGINYCSQIWKDPNYVGKKGTEMSDSCASHASLLVGSKNVQNKCHYLIKNSWGTQWGADNSKWKCLCRKNSDGSFVDDCTPATHPNKDFSVEACWIPKEILDNNTYSLTKIGET